MVASLGIVGAGLVGLATAHSVLQSTSSRVLSRIYLMESRPAYGLEQSGNNSGVIHAGLYYRPGSLRAKMCVTGSHKLYEFCKTHNLPYVQCGKLIVAQDTNVEYNALCALYKRAQQNKVPNISFLSTTPEIQSIEPNVSASYAIHSPFTGITDYSKIAHQLFELCSKDSRFTFLPNRTVTSITPNPTHLQIEFNHSNNTSLSCDFLALCPGLYADRVAQLAGGTQSPLIAPFRGTYHTIPSGMAVRGNVYPVPTHLGFPGLGVHLTPRIDGALMIGPNAALATSRRGYSALDVDVHDTLELAAHSGMRRLLGKHWKLAVEELYQDWVPSEFLKVAQRYCPEIQLEQCDAAQRRAGVHGIGVNADGTLVDDYLFEWLGNHRILALRTAPSPAATSCLALGDYLAEQMNPLF